MADAPTMPEDRRLRFEARIKLVRQISHAREQEQKRIGDQIEQLV